jgi:vacuolar-type H+-ATPase subunit F/Vma7
MRPGRIRVIGDQDAVLGLGLVGLEGQAVSTQAEARQALETALSDQGVSLILLTENWASLVQEMLAETMLAASGTIIVEIPSAQGAGPMLNLHERVERSLGLRLGN